MPRAHRFLTLLAGSLAFPFAAAAMGDAPRQEWTEDELATIASLRLSERPQRPVDPSNAHADDPLAIALGRRLFFDPGFSRLGTISCATCHDPAKQWQDGRPRAFGIALTARRTLPLADAGYGPWLFWDGRKDSLWSQALGPLEDAREHGGNRLRIARRVAEVYGTEYEAIFGRLPDLAGLPQDASPLGSASEAAAWAAMGETARSAVSRAFANMGKAIGAFVGTLRHGPSRFDRYAEAIVKGAPPGEDALDPGEVNGLRVFLGKGRCTNCHSGPLFTDHFFHSTRVPPLDPDHPDPGRAAGAKLVQADEFNCLGPFSDAKPAQCRELRFIQALDPILRRAFKTPGLRGVADRAPYMHAGQFATLEEVVDHYVRAPEAIPPSPGSRPGHGGGSELVPVPLSAEERRDLVRFLRTLSGPVVESPRP